MKSKLKLTPREEEVMEVFWREKRPLTTVDILEIAVDRTWKDRYLHRMITSILDKGLIQICGAVQYGKQYARQFEVTMDKEQYMAKVLSGGGLTPASFAKVTAAMAEEVKADDKEDAELMEELEAIINKLKEK